MNILFWNTQKKDFLLDEIVCLAHKHDIDILVLAECSIKNTALLLKLNAQKSDYFLSPDLICKKIQVFTKFPSRFIHSVHGDLRWSIRKIQLPLREDFLLVVVHLLSKVNWGDESLKEAVYLLKNTIEEKEQELGTRRTVVIGDFNMNPFEKAMVSTTGFHAVMDANIAKKSSRVVQAKEYPYFYNPMWGFYGDYGKGEASGTHYYRSSEHVCYFWNIFDQVLIRPAMMDEFEPDSLEILTGNNGSNYLRSNKTPNKTLFSDHLPIKLSFNIKSNLQ